MDRQPHNPENPGLWGLQPARDSLHWVEFHRLFLLIHHPAAPRNNQEVRHYREQPDKKQRGFVGDLLLPLKIHDLYWGNKPYVFLLANPAHNFVLQAQKIHLPLLPSYTWAL